MLLQYGLDPAHDQVYLRFLFKLGDKRGRHESLFASFERLLDELGIQIEFNTEEDAVEDVTRDVSHSNNAGVEQQSQRRSRRASFNSMYDAEDESTHAIQPRVSLSRLQIGEKSRSHARHSSRPGISPRAKTSMDASPIQKRSGPTPRERLTAEEFDSNFKVFPHKLPLVTSKDHRQPHTKDPTKHIRSAALTDGATATGNPIDSKGAAEDDTNEKSSAIDENAKFSQPDIRRRFYTPSKTQLLRDANTFQCYRIRSVARDLVASWCDAASWAKDHHEYLKRMAVAHDTEILLRQAFEHWRARLHARKQAAETERFFNHLERRAAKARNLYLVTKAFTHWAQCAQDEALRSVQARQYALGIKYFYAWREITVENHNKVQHHGLKKSFAVWKHRYIQSITDYIKADLLYQQSLSKNSYWHWFWIFCERRAPEWHTRGLKQKLFLLWVSKHRINARQLQVVNQNVDSKTKKDIFARWLAKSRAILSNERRAIAFDKRKIGELTLRAWARRRRFAPIAQQISNLVDWRVAGGTFAIFVNRFRFEKQTESINRLRMLRNFWTHWNDRLRWQTMAQRIDDRYLLEKLYKWVIAERCVLMQRLSQQRLKGRYLREWLLRVSTRHNHREQALQAVEKRRGSAYLQATVMQWSSQLREQRQAQRVAFRFHAPKLAHEVLELWKQGLKHTQQINTWAKDATFFFLGRRYLKRWKDAMLEARRQKRREVYVRVRRRYKMSLASSHLQHWHSIADYVLQLQHQADNANQQRLLRLGTICFDHWKELYSFSINESFDAKEHLDKQVLTRYLRIWSEKARGFDEYKETADMNAGLHMQKTAFIFIRKFQLKMIELKGQQGKAEGLRFYYEKRHFHNLVRQWYDKTAKRQSQPHEDRNFSANAQRTLRAAEDDNLGATRRAEGWTEFDAGDWIPSAEAQSSTTPLPGYLSTPSNRVARAKALLRSTTPVGTPFQNRLRAQLNATPRTGNKGFIGRSSNLRGSMVLEDSPTTTESLRLRNDE